MAGRGKPGATYAGLKQLGTQAAIPASPEAAVLERVPNPHPRKLYLARFTAPEFTSLCDAAAIDTSTGFFDESAMSFWTPSADGPDGKDAELGGAASKLSASRDVYSWLVGR